MREQEGEDEDRTAMGFIIIIIAVLVIGGILFAVLTGGGH